MRISESVLRKIIREEIESINENDLIGLGPALGMSPAEAQAIVAFLGASIGGLGAYNLAPQIKDGIMNLAKMLDANPKDSEEKVNEGAEGLEFTQQALEAAGALGTLAVVVAGSKSLADLLHPSIESAKDALLTLINKAKGTPSVNQDKV